METPIAPHWTAKFEYLFTDYGSQTVRTPPVHNRSASDFLCMKSAGVNYQFNNGSAVRRPDHQQGSRPRVDPDNVSFRGRTHLFGRALRNSGRQVRWAPTACHPGERQRDDRSTLYAGFRLWRGAEFGSILNRSGPRLAETHGVAGFPSGEILQTRLRLSLRAGAALFRRKTIDLGGETQKVDADVNQFAGSLTDNRLVITIGKFSIVDLFDTNKYANNRKRIHRLGADRRRHVRLAGDAWGYTYGAAVEWYRASFTFRAGVFDISAAPGRRALRQCRKLTGSTRLSGREHGRRN